MKRLIRFAPTSPWITVAAFICLSWAELNAADLSPTRTALVRAVDLDVNEAQELELADRTRVRVKLLNVEEIRDALRAAVRQARGRDPAR